MVNTDIAQPQPMAGIVSFLLGSLALLMVLTHLWAGPFAAQQRTEVTVGEIAVEMRQAAIRKLKGLPQPPPVRAPWTIDTTLKLLASLVAVFALIAGGASYVRGENRRAAVMGSILGGSAIGVQLFIWAILILAGAIILGAIALNVQGILGE